MMKEIMSEINILKELFEGFQEDESKELDFHSYLNKIKDNANTNLRNIFQLFRDMAHYYVGEGKDEYPPGSESIGYLEYDVSRLFEDGCDNKFFPDRPFTNRFMNFVDSLTSGAQQNKLHVFTGIHGCGKSTFLKILFDKFEEYTAKPEGTTYETLWKLDTELISPDISKEIGDRSLDIFCPSHDNPILLIPKDKRKRFLEEIIESDKQKEIIFNKQENSWIFKDEPCTVCSSISDALLKRLGSLDQVLKMVNVKKRKFDKRTSEGISVFYPANKITLDDIPLDNETLQKKLNDLFAPANYVIQQKLNLLFPKENIPYIFSRLAKINNGIYALMDIKDGYNQKRLMEIHNLISDGFHKVGDIEEKINSIFTCSINIEDIKKIRDMGSYMDRTNWIKIGYILNPNTEVKLYKDKEGKYIEDAFLPGVLQNYAKMIIFTRLKNISKTLKGWIKNPERYRDHTDLNLQLLKMEIYMGNIPDWLSEEDKQKFTKKRRERIIRESEHEGNVGYSGRESITLFKDFYRTHTKKDRLISMLDVIKFFHNQNKKNNNTTKIIPPGFIRSVAKVYNNRVEEQIKESLCDYNEENIEKEIMDYIFYNSQENGETVTSPYTGTQKKVYKGDLFEMDSLFLGEVVDTDEYNRFITDLHKRYRTEIVSQGIRTGEGLKETKIYKELYDRYKKNYRENILYSILDKEGLKRAIDEYNTDAFVGNDERMQKKAKLLLTNMQERFNYTERGAKGIISYALGKIIKNKE